MAIKVGRRRILAVIPTHVGCYRELIQGLSAYGNDEGRWILDISLPSDDSVCAVEVDKPDGLILGPIYSIESMKRAIIMVRANVGVATGMNDCGLGIPQVESDDFAVGVAGAAHLLSKGFRNYAYIHEDDCPWSSRRSQGFLDALERAGHKALVLSTHWSASLQMIVPANSHDGEISTWLSSQPKPLAIMACNDGRARYIAKVCLQSGLRVPDDVAILGVDNDDLSTAISNPPLSSVMIPWRQIGRLAASLLDRLISGERVAKSVQLLVPTGVAERRSTGGIAIEDEQVRTAVNFIRENAGSQITVQDVVAQVGTTRRALERKFRNSLSRSPLDEIRRCHIERAGVLLSQTALSIKQVAKQSGFGSVTWFTTAFRKQTGKSPARYRRQFKVS